MTDKEFWEWCGFWFDSDSWHEPSEPHWHTPDKMAIKELPPIDLNNLFKYAVPKIPKLKRIFMSAPTEDTITKGWIVDVESGGFSYLGSNEDPAQALKQAIVKVKENEDEVS